MNVEASLRRSARPARTRSLAKDERRKALFEIFRQCADFVRLRQVEMALGFNVADQDDRQIFDIYLNNPIVALTSPNALFDEQWYRDSNPDVAAAIAAGRFQSGFLHFIQIGIIEGRWPSKAMLSFSARRHSNPLPVLSAIIVAAYLAANPEAREFLGHFPIMGPLAHYNAYGRFLGLPAVPPDLPQAKSGWSDSYFDAMAAEFDAAWYQARYINEPAGDAFADDVFSHYLIHGIPRGHSPSAAFDEQFYRAFYPDIGAAVVHGDIPCGFYHYVVAGRAEGRLPGYERKLTLEARIPGVTEPALLERLPALRARLQPRRITVDETSLPRVWILLPTMNPDLTFGGYRSALELLRRLHDSGHSVTILCTEDSQADKSYFLWRESSPEFRRVMQSVTVIGFGAGRDLTVGPQDTVLVYSLWDIYAADEIRRHAPATRVILLVQEFEPIFYDYCSARAQLVEAYRIPHYPLINSGFLQRYLEVNRVGVFDRPTPPVLGRDYFTFEHKINRLLAQSAEQMSGRAERILIAYARPERHASRNMFETVILALRQVHSEGLFGPEWTFIGLGSLTELEPVPIGGTQKMMLKPKMSEEEYTRYISMMDIGISLMFAPHPSVVPFEFATTGALVVTNSFENRSEDELRAISPNIIAGRPTIAGIAQALRDALQRVPDVESRVRHIYRPRASNWDEIFNDAMLKTVFGEPA